MESNMIFYVFIALTGVFISSVSQVLLKKAALRQYDSLLKEYMNSKVVFAYILFIGATLMAVFAYKEIPLSLGPILEATGYIFITFFGVKLFHEKIDKKRISALGLIVVGIIIYSIFP